MPTLPRMISAERDFGSSSAMATRTGRKCFQPGQQLNCGVLPSRTLKTKLTRSAASTGWSQLRASFQAFDLKINGSIFVGLVTFWAFEDALPVRALPLRMLRIVNERGILIREGSLAGFASYKPMLAHLEIYRGSDRGNAARQRREPGVVTFEQTRRPRECINGLHL